MDHPNPGQGRQQPQQPLPTEINIVSLNCWGLKFLSKHRAARLAEIGRRLATASPPPHVVALQELWTQEDYLCVRRATADVLPYGKFYFAGVLGGGLAILSRWPLDESSYLPYPINGTPAAPHRGDWYVGKGVACARVRYGPDPRRHVLAVFNTHTHAPYAADEARNYALERAAQAWEAARLMRRAGEAGHVVVACGDFNMVPADLGHRIVTARAGYGLRDAWQVLHPDSAVGSARDEPEVRRGRPVPTAAFNLTENGMTSDNVFNTWRWTKAEQKKLGPGRPAVVIPPDTPDPRGHRLDYIFAGPGDREALGGSWVVAAAKVGMVEPHPELGCSVSDHFSVEVTLRFQRDRKVNNATTGKDRPSSAEKSDDDEDEALHNGAYLQSPTTSETRGSKIFDTAPLTSASYVEQPQLPLADYDEMLTLIQRRREKIKAERWWRGLHFFASVAITIGCLVAVWFSPRNFVAFILVLVSSLNLVAGTLDGLIALLFVKSNKRTLKEFEWEVINAKAIAEGSDGHVLPADQGPQQSW